MKQIKGSLYKRQPHSSSCPLVNFMEHGTPHPPALSPGSLQPDPVSRGHKEGQTRLAKARVPAFGYLKSLKLPKQKQGVGALIHPQ